MPQLKTSIAVASGLAIAAALGQPALAQQAGSNVTMAEIVVTAQKREERLIDVPVSVAVVGGDIISDYKITALDELDRLVPSLYINSTPGNNAVFIRGIGSTAGNLAVEQSVALFVDGVYAGRARQFMAPFLDVERVEVLRGPQGATFGINTSAGAVSVVTARPTKEFTGNAKASYEFEYDSWEVGGVVSGPLADRLQGRLAVNYQDIGGYLKNTITGRDDPSSENFLVRGSLAWQPTDNISALFKIEHADFDTEGSNFQRVLSSRGYTIDKHREEGEAWHKDKDDSKATNAQLTIDFDLGVGTMTSITGYSQFEYSKWINPSAVPEGAYLTNFKEHFQQFSQELRFASEVGGRFEYLVGGYFHYNEIDPLQADAWIRPVTFAPQGFGTSAFTQDSQVFSLFGSLTWNINEQWSLSADLRYTDDDKRGTQVRSASATAPGAWTDLTLSGRRSDSTLDPRLKLKWQPSEDLMVYASYTEGSKSGGWQGNDRSTTAATWEIEGESSENFELGMKLRLLEGRAFIAATAFHTEFEDLQVSQWAGTSFLTKNAAKATSKGLEVDGSWRIAEQWSLQGGIAYLDADYDSFPDGQCAWGNAPSCTQDLTGARLGWSPEWSGNLAVMFEQVLNDRLMLRATLSAQYRDDTWLEMTGDRNVKDSMQKSTTWLDGRVALGIDDDRWVVALYGRNLTNEKTKSHVFQFPFPANVITDPMSYVIGTDRFREIGVELSYNF
ncbi:MAG: TonB-dependent receptor [Gammaproteobacteria bacterium]|nr:TonB-dependent receptor [Gammaproteobacteria bacterium]